MTPRMRSATRARRVTGIAAASAFLVALTSCTTEADSNLTASTESSSPSAPASGSVETVAADLDAPWSIAFHGNTALVSERDTARILELDRDGNTREVGTIDGVAPLGEAGLLGITVRDRHLYAYFTASAENRIERFPLRGELGSLSLGPAETVLDGLAAASYHNGGRIAFGPDGMLYATVGDAGDADSAQNLDSLSGKILRMTPEGGVPSDNPFPDSLVYSYGHRNPQGIAWAEDGTLYASEFGQDTWDELNIIEPGRNYGWPEVEGVADQNGLIDPVQQWGPAEASPSGIAISGDNIYIANLRGERLREVPLDDLTASTDRFTGEYGRFRDAVVAPDGSLWVLTNNTDGRGDPEPGDDRILRLNS